MIRQTHRRLEQRCALMDRLADHLRESGCDADAQATAGHIVRFFDDEMARHHEDEERDFYDAVIEAAPAKSRNAITDLVTVLRAEHEKMHNIWREELRPQLMEVMAGRSASLDKAAVDRCHILHVNHLNREEGELMPIAEEQLSPERIERLGRSMAERRNQHYPGDA